MGALRNKNQNVRNNLNICTEIAVALNIPPPPALATLKAIKNHQTSIEVEHSDKEIFRLLFFTVLAFVHLLVPSNYHDFCSRMSYNLWKFRFKIAISLLYI
jgi:hypothetical protein